MHHAHILRTAHHWMVASRADWPMHETDTPLYQICMATIVVAAFTWFVTNA